MFKIKGFRNTDEWQLIVSAGGQFFLLMVGLTVLRPVRDAMGVQAGVESLPHLFTATWIGMIALVPVFGLATRSLPLRLLIPFIYALVAVQLLGFVVATALNWQPVTNARIFFVWLSVINLFLISLFWSMMSDRLTPDQATRCFSRIAVGGSLGTLVGPTLAAWFAESILTLMGISLACLLLSILMLQTKGEGCPSGTEDNKIDGNPFSGIMRLAKSRSLTGITLLIMLYTMTSTFLYLKQSALVKIAILSQAEQMRYFATLDITTNTLAILGQAWITPRIIRSIGFARALTMIPLLVTVGLAIFSMIQTLPLLFLLLAIHRGGSFAISRPCREMLFTGESREDRYRAKNFSDTTLYRSGDAISAWLFAGMPSGMAAWASTGIAGLWLVVARKLGHRHEQQISTDRSTHEEEKEKSC